MANFYDLTHLEVVNEYVTIRRYRESDFGGLNAIFKQEFFMWFFTAYKNCQEFVKEKIDEFEHGDLVMLVIIDNLTGKIIGTSSLYDISFRHKRLEIGSSWLDSNYQGTAYNAIAKKLLITTLIEKLGFNRVQLKCDALNEKSRHAMLKLGFVYEGTLHRHAVTFSGRVRDSLVFAITDITWNNIQTVMTQRISQKLQYSAN